MESLSTPVVQGLNIGRLYWSKMFTSKFKSNFKKLYDYFELFIKIDSEFLPVCCVLGHLTVFQSRRNKFSKVF